MHPYSAVLVRVGAALGCVGDDGATVTRLDLLRKFQAGI